MMGRVRKNVNTYSPEVKGRQTLEAQVRDLGRSLLAEDAPSSSSRRFVPLWRRRASFLFVFLHRFITLFLQTCSGKEHTILLQSRVFIFYCRDVPDIVVVRLYQSTISITIPVEGKL
jgi:hypothetical protein